MVVSDSLNRNKCSVSVNSFMINDVSLTGVP